MKKRYVICLACIMMGVMMLCGCDIDDIADLDDFDVAGFFFHDKTEETIVEDKPVEETPMPVISINDVGEEKREEVTLPEIKEDGLPKFYISTEHASDYGEDTEWINHRFDQIHMVTDDDSYSEIGKHLDEVNKGITQNEQILMRGKRAWVSRLEEKEITKRKESGYFPVNEEWNIYVRRADRRVLSIAVEYRGVLDEGFSVLMRAHNYSMTDGRELEPADIVEDEEAFYALLADRLKAVVTRDMMVYTGEKKEVDFDAASFIKACRDNNRLVWTMDPQGMTFWFENVNKAISRVSATVLFSDDKEGTIFKDEFVKGAPEEWVMQIPGNYSEVGFDCEDDGNMDTMGWLAQDNTEDNGKSYVSGISVVFNDRYFESNEICPANGAEWSDYKAMLMHRDSKTVLLISHLEDEIAYLNSFALESDNVNTGDSKAASIVCPDGNGGYGNAVPRHMSGLVVRTATDPENPENLGGGYLYVGTDGTLTVIGTD